jgi:hypothetical protein
VNLDAPAVFAVPVAEMTASLQGSLGRGHLLLWNLDAKEPRYQTFDHGHNRSVFTIVSYPCGRRAATISMDRKVRTQPPNPYITLAAAVTSPFL